MRTEAYSRHYGTIAINECQTELAQKRKLFNAVPVLSPWKAEQLLPSAYEVSWPSRLTYELQASWFNASAGAPQLRKGRWANSGTLSGNESNKSNTACNCNQPPCPGAAASLWQAAGWFPSVRVPLYLSRTALFLC